MPPIQKWSKLFAPEKIIKNWRDLKKIDFQHATITLGLVKSNNIYVS